MILRDYQAECAASNKRILWEECARSTLNVMPTGTGKTPVLATLAHECPEGRVMIAAHRDELIRQAAKTVAIVTGEEPEIEKGDERAGRHGMFSSSKVVVTSVQTQNAGRGDKRRMNRFDPNEFGLLLIDEAHRSVAKTYRQMINHYCQNPNLKVVGFTATPDRADEQALQQVFERVAYEMHLPPAVQAGWLVRPNQQFVDVDGLDLSSVTVGNDGDLKASDLEAQFNAEEKLHSVAWPMIDICGDRQAMIFVPGVQSAHTLADILNGHRPGKAAALDGTIRTRDPATYAKVLADYKNGSIQFLVNVELFCEGFDSPNTSVIGMARPTKSRAKYSQMVGRATRPLPGTIEALLGTQFWRLETPEERCAAIAASNKPECLILDFVGNSGRHSLVSLGDILGGRYKDEVVARAKKNAKKKSDRGEKSDMIEELEEAEKEIQNEAYAHRQKLICTARYSLRSANGFDTFGIVKTREPGWHRGRTPSQKQLECLERSGVPTKDLSFTDASRLVQEVIDRSKKGLASYKQLAILERNHVFAIDGKKLTECTFGEVSRRIDQLSKEQGWGRNSRRPQLARS